MGERAVLVLSFETYSSIIFSFFFNFFLSLWNVKQLPVWSWRDVFVCEHPYEVYISVVALLRELDLWNECGHIFPGVAGDSHVTLVGDVARVRARASCETGFLLSSIAHHHPIRGMGGSQGAKGRRPEGCVQAGFTSSKCVLYLHLSWCWAVPGTSLPTPRVPSSGCPHFLQMC